MNSYLTPARSFAEGIGQAVADRTIARVKDDGTRENWADVALRVAKGNTLLCPDGADIQGEFHAMHHHLRQASLLMSGRHLQHGDETQPGRNLEVFTNCSTAATSFALFYLLLNGSGVGRAYDDHMMAVDWRNLPNVYITIDADYPDYEKGLIPEGVVAKEEILANIPNCDVYEVEDSREGWGHAVELLETLAYGGNRHGNVIIDFSKVRPNGSPIRGMQNRPSSGPGATMQAMLNCIQVRNTDYEPWKQAMYVDHYLAESVLVGGARRAARMATKDWRDETVLDFISVKQGGVLWSSNNSVTVDEMFWRLVNTPASGVQWESDETKKLWSHAQAVFEAVCHHSYFDGTGEPGFINQDKLTANMEGIEVYDESAAFMSSAKFSPSVWSEGLLEDVLHRFKSSRFKMITNPCGEITLTKVGGYCTIADVVPYHAQSIEDAHDAFRVAARALIRTNLMDCLYRKEVDRTNRIGIGMTGFHEFAFKFFGLGFRDMIDESKSQDFWNTVASFSRAVKDEAKRYSAYLGVKTPHTDTTFKPAGTTSKLFGLTEGAHLPAMAEYLRYVQFRSDDPLIEQYRAAGYPIKELVNYTGTTVVGFPTVPEVCKLGMGDKMVTASEATPEEQYQYLRLLEKYWIRGVDEAGVPLKETGNQVSYTLKYDPKTVSYDEFRRTLAAGQSTIRCCSVMPKVDTSAYEYQPETPISRAEFDELVAHIARGIKEDIGFEHVDCGSGACPITFEEGDRSNDWGATKAAEDKAPKWLVFSTKTCPACKAAKDLLTERGLEFDEINIQNTEGFDFLRSYTTRKTVPVIVHGGQVIGDFNDLQAYLQPA